MRILCEENCVPYPVRNSTKGWAFFTTVLVLFMPKCAMCWAAYMSLFSAAGIVIGYQPWFVPVTAILFAITLGKLLITSFRRRNFAGFCVAVIAGMMIFLQRKVPGINAIKITALLLMFIAIQKETLLIVFHMIKRNSRAFLRDLRVHFSHRV